MKLQLLIFNSVFQEFPFIDIMLFMRHSTLDLVPLTWLCWVSAANVINWVSEVGQREHISCEVLTNNI